MNPPSALHSAMGRERKPFTYTPGGLDLSEIKSERMAKRLMRNAMNEGVPQIPVQQVQSPPASNIAVPNFNCLPVQVFPTFNLPANPKSLLRTRSHPNQPREPLVPKVQQPSQIPKPNRTENTAPFTTVNNNNASYQRPTSMYEYNANPNNSNTLPRTNYSSSEQVSYLPEISYEAEYLRAPPRNSNGFNSSNQQPVYQSDSPVESESSVFHNFKHKDQNNDKSYKTPDTSLSSDYSAFNYNFDLKKPTDYNDSLKSTNASVNVENKVLSNYDLKEPYRIENNLKTDNVPAITESLSPTFNVTSETGKVIENARATALSNDSMNTASFNFQLKESNTVERNEDTDEKAISFKIKTKPQSDTEYVTNTGETLEDPADTTSNFSFELMKPSNVEDSEITEDVTLSSEDIALPEDSKLDLDFSIQPISLPSISPSFETKPIEEIIRSEDEQKEVKVVKKQVKKESKSEVQNGESNGDSEAQLTVKLPTKKSAAKTETKVEVVKKQLPDGSIEEVKTTITKTTVDGKTTIATKTETTIIPKEEEEEEEYEEEEEQEEEDREVIVQEVKENGDNEVIEEVVIKKTPAVVQNGEKTKIVTEEERSETTVTKKVAVTQKQEPEEEEEEEVVEEEAQEEETKTVIEAKKEEVEEEEAVEEEVVEKGEVQKEEEVEAEETEVQEVAKPEKNEKPQEPVEEEQEEVEEEYEEAEEKVEEKVEKPVESKPKDEESEYTEEEYESEKEEPAEKPAQQPAKEETEQKEPEKEEAKVEEKKEVVEEKQAEPTPQPEPKVEVTIPLREPSIPLEKVEDVEIKPIGAASETITKSHTQNTEIITSNERPSAPLSTQTEYNRIENIVTVNRTTKTLDSTYEQLTQHGIPTVKTYFAPGRERVSTSPQPAKPYQPVYPPAADQPQERRHSLLLERLSMERQVPSSDLYQNNYQYNQAYEQQRQWSQEPQAEVLTVSNVKPSTITNSQWYQQNQSIKENVLYNNVTPASPAPPSQWDQSYLSPQPPLPPQTPVQPQTQPQPHYQPTYTDNVTQDRNTTYQQNNYQTYTPKPTTWGNNTYSNTDSQLSTTYNTQQNQYSLRNQTTTESYQKSTQQYSSSYVPPPWEQDSSYVAPSDTSNQNYYQPPPPASTYTAGPNQGWTPAPPKSKFSKPPPTAYIPPAPNQSFVKNANTVEPPRVPGKKTYYSEYERRYITVPESNYIPGESKFQPQPDPSPQYYYDNNEPVETSEPQWRKELREFTEKTSSQTTGQTSVKPPWEEDSKYAKPPPSSTYTPTPTWSQTLRPNSYRERSFESEYVGSQEYKTNTLGRGRPLSTYAKSNVDTIPERVRGVSVDRYNPNSYQPPAEHPPVQSHTLNVVPPAKSYHNPNVPAYHAQARASVEPREQPIYPQPRQWESRASPLQSRSFKYLQWITGTED